MNHLQNWVFSVCVTMVGAGIFSLMSPNSHFKKVMTFTISLFFLSSLLSPFLFSMPDLDLSVVSGQLTQNEELNQKVSDQVVEETKSVLAKQLGQIFQENGYKIDALAIDMNKTDFEDAGTSSLQVHITLPPEERKAEGNIRALTQSSLGVVPSIEYS